MFWSKSSYNGSRRYDEQEQKSIVEILEANLNPGLYLMKKGAEARIVEQQTELTEAKTKELQIKLQVDKQNIESKKLDYKGIYSCSNS